MYVTFSDRVLWRFPLVWGHAWGQGEAALRGRAIKVPQKLDCIVQMRFSRAYYVQDT